MTDPKQTLIHYLQGARDALLWKLDGLSEYDVRRPLMHVATETHQHAGHADIVRELIDGSTGFLTTASNLPADGYDRPAYVAKVQASADAFH